MSLPAAYLPIEFSAQHRPTCGLQRLRSVVKRLHLSVFVLDVSSSNVRFPVFLLGYIFNGVLYLCYCVNCLHSRVKFNCVRFIQYTFEIVSCWCKLTWSHGWNSLQTQMTIMLITEWPVNAWVVFQLPGRPLSQCSPVMSVCCSFCCCVAQSSTLWQSMAITSDDINNNQKSQ